MPKNHKKSTLVLLFDVTDPSTTQRRVVYALSELFARKFWYTALIRLDSVEAL